MYYELYHHGILGQKWGKRNGPPYPLGSSDHSASEKKAGWQKSLSSKTVDKTNDKEYNKGTLNARNAQEKSFVERYSDKKISQIGDTDGIVKELAALAITYAVSKAAIYSKAKFNEHFEKKFRQDRMEELERYNKNKEIKSFAEAPRLSQKMSARDSMKLINPDFPSEGTTMNCTLCTTAMALREKGYDVRARKNNDGFYPDDLFKATFNSPIIKMPKNSTSNDVLKILASNGEGAYGNLSIKWISGGGHSIFWKVENGRTHIYDGQAGKEYTESALSTEHFMSCVNLSNIRYNRLDNCTPTEYALAAVERNNKK